MLIGVRLGTAGIPAAGRPLLLVANHTSWLDIIVLGAALPVAFIAKSEVRGWPGIGWLARLQRTVFVDRARRSATGATAADIAGRLRAGEAVVLFAEGTSSDHNRVLPFRSALIGAALAAGGTALVQPVSVAYPRRHGLPVLRRDRPKLAWYGGMELAGHLWRVLSEGGVEAVVSFGTPLAAGAGADRKMLARLAETEVRAMMRRVLRAQPRPDPDAAGVRVEGWRQVLSPGPSFDMGLRPGSG